MNWLVFNSIWSNIKIASTMESESIVKLRVTKSLLTFFQLNGMLLVTISRKVIFERILIGLALFYIIFLSVSLAISLHYYRKIFDTRNSLGLFMDVIQLAIPIGTHILILTQSFSRREFHRKIWEHFVNVDTALKGFGIETAWKLKSFLRRYATKFIFMLGIGCGVEIWIIGIIFNISDGWKWHRILAFTPFLGNRLCQLMLMFYSELYREFLHIINHELENVVHISEGVGQNSVKIFLAFQKSKCLRKCYNNLWLINKYINKSFGWSIFFNISMNFIILIVDYYWNFKAIFLSSSVSSLASVLCCVPLVVCLLLFIQSCDSSLRPIQNLKHLIGKIPFQGKPRHFKRFFKQFSMQMLQMDSQLNASGFFFINYELLHGVRLIRKL